MPPCGEYQDLEIRELGSERGINLSNVTQQVKAELGFALTSSSCWHLSCSHQQGARKEASGPISSSLFFSCKPRPVWRPGEGSLLSPSHSALPAIQSSSGMPGPCRRGSRRQLPERLGLVRRCGMHGAPTDLTRYPSKGMGGQSHLSLLFPCPPLGLCGPQITDQPL